MIFVANRSTPTATKAFSGRRVCPTNEKCSLTPVMRVFSQNSLCRNEHGTTSINSPAGFNTE